MSKGAKATASQDDEVFADSPQRKSEPKGSLLYVTRDKTFDLVFCGITPTKKTHDGKLVYEIPKKDFEDRIKNDFRIKQGILVPYKE